MWTHSERSATTAYKPTSSSGYDCSNDAVKELVSWPSLSSIPVAFFPSHRVFNHSEVRLATLPNELKSLAIFLRTSLYLGDTKELFQQILASDGNRSDPPIENRVNLDCETCQSWPSHSMILMAPSIILGWNVLTRRTRWHFGCWVSPNHAVMTLKS